MIDKIKQKEKCCGCGACASICPVNAITIQVDCEGFEYPIVNKNKCIQCGKCNKICPIDNYKAHNSKKKPRTYAVKHKDEGVRKESRSGGIFSALSDKILDEGGVIYGAVLEENFTVKHIRAEKKEQRDLMRGSKYVQSSTAMIMKQVKDDLDDGRTVMFSGTSCQVDGLYAYLGKRPANLFCIDIVCHGVPSPKVFKKYIEWQEKRNNSKCKKIHFRNKQDFGWADHIETLWMDNGTRIDSKIYAQIFYSDYPLRPSCYECPYKSINHPSDISIADYWNIDKASPGFNDNKGVSLVLINSEKGQKLFDSISNNIDYKETKIEDSMQKPLMEPSKCPKDREEFWKKLNSEDFSIIAREYGGFSKKELLNEKLYLIKSRIKRIIKKQ